MPSNELELNVTVDLTDEVKSYIDEAAKVGARHSGADLADMQTVHDIAVKQGAMCGEWEEGKSVHEPEEGKVFTNALKAVGKTDDELRVANYIVLHGGRDLTAFIPKAYGGGPNPDGSKGEFFSERTDVESSYTKTGVLHVDFEHGWDIDGLGADKNEVLGYVDWKTAKRDKRGIFVERVLNRRNEYVQWLEELIEEGLLGNSTEAIPDGIEKAKNGEILKWPLRRDTLTVQPMEPRMISQNAFTAIQNLAKAIPQFKTLLENVSDTNASETPVTSDGEVTVTEPTANIYQEGTTTNADLPLSAKEIAMAENTQGGEVVTPEVKIDYELLATKVAEKLDAPGAAKSVPAVIKAESLGNPDPYLAFAKWAKGGSAKGIGALGGKLINDNEIYFEGKNTKAALQEASGEGAEIVPDDFFPQIIAKRDQGSIARRAGARVLSTSRDIMNIPAENASMANFAVTAEEAAYTQNEPTFATVAVTVYKFTKLIKISEELLEDEQANLDAFLTDAIGRSWALTENEYVIAGTGSGQPQGLLTGGSVGYTFADTNSIAATEIPSLYWSLGDPYHDGAVWIMKGATAGHLQSLTGNNFQLVPTPYMPTQMVGDIPMTLWGKPVFISDSVPSVLDNLKSVIFANLNYYALVERRGLTISRNPYLYQANGQVGIFCSVRFGGAVLQSEAVKWGVQV